jgi:hypothetical protein
MIWRDTRNTFSRKEQMNEIVMLASIAECLLRAAAMQAANAHRDQRGLSQAYGEECFWTQADVLAAIAAEAQEKADNE